MSESVKCHEGKQDGVRGIERDTGLRGTILLFYTLGGIQKAPLKPLSQMLTKSNIKNNIISTPPVSPAITGQYEKLKDADMHVT